MIDLHCHPQAVPDDLSGYAAVVLGNEAFGNGADSERTAMERRLILTRHAEAGESSVYWGSRDVRLSPKGVRTASEIATAVSSVRAAAVMSSPQARAIETATIMARRLDPRGGGRTTCRKGLRGTARKPATGPARRTSNGSMPEVKLSGIEPVEYIIGMMMYSPRVSRQVRAPRSARLHGRPRCWSLLAPRHPVVPRVSYEAPRMSRSRARVPDRVVRVRVACGEPVRSWRRWRRWMSMLLAGYAESVRRGRGVGHQRCHG